MKNSTIYVVGGLILLSGVAFLYMKYKKKPQGDLATQTDETGATTTGATSGSTTTGSTTTGSTSTQNADDVKKLSEATDIAKQIDAINKKIDALNNAKNIPVPSFGFGQSAFTRNARYQLLIDDLKKSAVPLVEKIKDLGYTESYGLPVKIR